jgi:hypothetical protein
MNGGDKGPAIIIPGRHDLSWRVDRTEKAVLLRFRIGPREMVAAMTADDAKTMAGALNAAGNDILRDMVFQRGEIVGRA